MPLLSRRTFSLALSYMPYRFDRNDIQWLTSAKPGEAMETKHRCLMVGLGGMGSRWVRHIWQPFRDRMEFAGLVDPNPAALHEAADWLGLPSTARFAAANEAFARIDADFCCIVTPPAHHREAVELACARGMDILSEKPIADTRRHAPQSREP